MLSDSDKKWLKEQLVILFGKKDYIRAYWELIASANTERNSPIDIDTEAKGLEMVGEAKGSEEAIFKVFETFVDGLMSSGAIQTSIILKEFLSKKPPKSDNFSKGLILTGSIILSILISKQL